MKNSVESREEDANVSSSFRRLPDEIILQIFNKLIDLKTLCFCHLISKHFSSIVLQIEAISFTAPLLNPHISDKNTVSDVSPSQPFLSAHRFLSKFKGVKFLWIELPSSSHRDIDDRLLFRWKAKFCSRMKSFIFLSPHSIFDKDGFCINGNGEEEEEEEDELRNDMLNQKLVISFQCFRDAMVWHSILLYLVKDLPKLEKVSITDLGRRGKLSLSGEKLIEVKEWVHSASEAVMTHLELPTKISNGYIPVLKLPVSGYVMKGIHFCVMKMKDLGDGNDGVMNNEDASADKEEAAYTEAVMEILEKHTT
ncbi:unnamed protein product [Lactuca virosa]|uniref:F-box domain-containing protein n=1 Tax=Lactuca virosa TaxID=75947 RepID=A0AAU9LH22_9ASTR|nr:unnamed protein product [Lactuca virosa]